MIVDFVVKFVVVKNLLIICLCGDVDCEVLVEIMVIVEENLIVVFEVFVICNVLLIDWKNGVGGNIVVYIFNVDVVLVVDVGVVWIEFKVSFVLDVDVIYMGLDFLFICILVCGYKIMVVIFCNIVVGFKVFCVVFSGMLNVVC